MVLGKGQGNIKSREASVDFKQFLKDKAQEKKWTQAALEIYLLISERLQKNEPLRIRAGAGGISFYKETGKGPVFLVHFVVAPKRLPSLIGYLDFRKEPLKQWMHVPDLVKDLKHEAGPDTIFREDKKWGGLSFPLDRAGEIADLIEQRIVAKVGNSDSNPGS